ncbi:hypothetical protein SAMN05660909_05656 [Chitinophaga terrae (ex Kim and Jung 2007)]|uniref:Uncharacterized protein n=1 Tax=Chitinophaga terrae (ex Kim and Jung 2007) TaxID=408074 RepID=A0A1H4GS01_9BACT|nr:hypothetical protein SAMN05660909_05656 [Chitinophaga terrae (ex Kim and Jung 2007)]
MPYSVYKDSSRQNNTKVVFKTAFCPTPFKRIILNLKIKFDGGIPKGDLIGEGLV